MNYYEVTEDLIRRLNVWDLTEWVSQQLDSFNGNLVICEQTAEDDEMQIAAVTVYREMF